MDDDSTVRFVKRLLFRLDNNNNGAAFHRQRLAQQPTKREMNSDPRTKGYVWQKQS